MSPSSKDSGRKPPERREDERLATRIDAVIDDVRYLSLVFTASGFSRTGAFLQRREGTGALPAVGSTIRLIFRWPLETNMPPVRVDAKVMRQTDDGVGVQFEIK